nr:MAG: nonstructural protein [Microvirus sp.]
MRFLLFSIFDRKAGVYLSPFPSRAVIDAERSIVASFRDNSLQGTPVAAHPEDFALYLIGRFDDETGYIDATTSQLIAELQDLRANASRGSSTVSS